MTNLRPFQIFVLALFGFLAILSVVLLSNFQSKATNEQLTYGESVVIWGTFDEGILRQLFQDITDNNDDGFSRVSYRQIDEREFNNILVSAIAENRGPDMILLPSSEFVQQRNRLFALSYDMLSKREFKDRYIDGAEIFARPDGVYAVPVLVDPLMLYWNRDLFSSAGLAQAPTTWEYVVNYAVPNLTIKDNKRNILQASLPFGEVENVRNAKEILLTLAMQSGSKLIEEDQGRYTVSLNTSVNDSGLPPLEAATQFFLNFSNPNSSLYTWNRSQPMDRNAFIAGDLAMYVGFGSEMGDITRQNPNLNFDVAQMPQGASATIRRTFGEFYGLAILKSSQNPQGAYAAASVLASPSIGAQLAEALGLAPVSRSALAAVGEDPFRVVLYGAALTTRTWLDPNSDETKAIFRSLTEGVTSGRDSLNRLVGDTEQKIRLAF